MFERLQRRQPQDKPLLNLKYAEYLLLFRRAAANLQVNMVPCQGRHSGASVHRAENLRTLESIQKRGRWKSAKSVRRYEKNGTCCSELAPLGPGTVRTLQQPPALGFTSSPCLAYTASTGPSFVTDFFSANTDVQQFFLNRGVQCAKLDPFSDDYTIFDENSKDFAPSGRTLAVMLSPPVSSVSVARNRRPLRSATRPW